MIRLGVNVDHVATVRQARGEAYPDPVQAALLCELGGARNITCHLREDRRHIQDRDLFLLKNTIKIPLNFEMAATAEMMEIAKKVQPEAITIVPEKRAELTTEGGLDVRKNSSELDRYIGQLKSGTSALIALFVENSVEAVETSKALGADAVEIHTGRFCHAIDKAITTREKRSLVAGLVVVARKAYELGLQVHYGHGLHYGNANWLQLVEEAEEANIGHSIISRAVFVGLRQAVEEMNDLLNCQKHKP